MIQVRASKIAELLNEQLRGLDLDVLGISSIDHPQRNTMVFAASLTGSNRQKIQEASPLLLLWQRGDGIKPPGTYIPVDNSKLAYATVLQLLMPVQKASISSSAIIHEKCKIGSNVTIGSGCEIGESVQIGDNTIVGSNTVIVGKASIGADCWIGSGAVIGEQGFGFAFGENNTATRVPHLGGVRIGDRVEIGCRSIISRGTISDTVIGDDVKINDLVHIAHNCRIGNRVIVAGGKVSGSAHVGDDAWLAPGSVIRNKVCVGAKAVVGVGAVVVGDVGDGETVVGNPARPLNKKRA